MDDFGTVVCQFGGLVGRDDGHEAGRGDFARVGSEDPVDFFPDLELAGGEADGAEGGAEVGVPPPDLGQE